MGRLDDREIRINRLHATAAQYGLTLKQESESTFRFVRVNGHQSFLMWGIWNCEEFMKGYQFAMEGPKTDIPASPTSPFPDPEAKSEPQWGFDDTDVKTQSLEDKEEEDDDWNNW